MNPLVSVIVPTKNSGTTLEACLKSIAEQTYKNIEIIVVDNFSEDATQEIAKKYTEFVYSKGPERSAQRNYGASTAKGEFVVFIDSDMTLTSLVIESCIQVMENSEISGVIIPEESFGEGFWAQCKALERSFYVGVEWMEAARFFRKTVFDQINGYNEEMVSGEDWDLSQRAQELGKIGRVQDFILHNEGKLQLLTTLRKKYYYAKKFVAYQRANKNHKNIQKQTGMLRRYWLFFRHPVKLLRNPIVGIGLLLMKTCEFGTGGISIISNFNKL